MFKSLIAASVLAVATAVPVFAAPSTCWLSSNTSRNGDIPAQQCDVHIRTNANGHRGIDVMTPVDGQTMTVVLWTDSRRNPSYAEVIFHDLGRTTMSYRWDNEGDLHLYKGDNEMYVRMPY